MDSFNKYSVRMQPLCIMWLLVLQMLPLNASIPLRSIYWSDFTRIRILGIFLSLLF